MVRVGVSAEVAESAEVVEGGLREVVVSAGVEGIVGGGVGGGVVS